MSIDLGKTLRTLATLATVGLFGAEAGAETFEYLTYTPPPGWTAGQAQDGRTYLYQGATAAVVVILFNSRPTQLPPAKVFAEEWRARLAAISVPAPALQLGEDGDVTVAAGSAQATKQGKPVTAVLATLVGRGRALSIVAIASGDGGQHVSAFLDTFSIAPAAATAPQAEAQPPRDKRRPGRSAEIAGLYLWQGFEYTYTPDVTGRTSGSSGTVYRTHFYLLSEDGRVARGSGYPQQVPDRFDFDDYQRRDPAASGTYNVERDRVILHMGAGTLVATVADGQIEIEKRKYKRSIALP